MGRPREFDEDKVLEAARDAFWVNGYEGTSTRALSECTGLTQSSLYAAYGDKRGVFLRALDLYLDQSSRKRIARLESSMSPGRAIVTFFSEIVDWSLADAQRRGCMLVNTALEIKMSDPDLRRVVLKEMGAIEDFFQRCILAGRISNEISAEGSAVEHAKHLLAVLIGLRVMARIAPNFGRFTDILRPALAQLNLPWPPSSRSSPARARDGLT